MDSPSANAPPAPRGSEQSTPTTSRSASLLTYWLPLLLVLYFLSPGPVILLAEGHPAAEKPAGLFLAPMRYLYDHFPPAHSFYDWYLGKLWGI